MLRSNSFVAVNFRVLCRKRHPWDERTREGKSRALRPSFWIFPFRSGMGGGQLFYFILFIILFFKHGFQIDRGVCVWLGRDMAGPFGNWGEEERRPRAQQS